MTLPAAAPENAISPPVPPNAPPFEIDDSHLITEDGKPVDNLYSEKLFRLLTDTLYLSWKPGRKFMCCSDVGVFYMNSNPAIVPDVFLSMDVEPFPDLMAKAGRSYLMWEKGKPPDIVIEIVSNTEGEELTRKRQIYAERVRAPYYVVWDRDQILRGDRLTVFWLNGLKYLQIPAALFPEVGLGLTVWSGRYNECESEWLRWTDLDGNLIPMGAEVVETAARDVDLERRRADAAETRAEVEKQRAEAEKRRADAALAKLRELGIDPNTLDQ